MMALPAVIKIQQRITTAIVPQLATTTTVTKDASILYITGPNFVDSLPLPASRNETLLFGLRRCVVASLRRARELQF